jgi:hypothetical protein
LSTVRVIPASTSETVIVSEGQDSYNSIRGVHIYNDSTADLYVKFGEGVSVDSFTVKLPGGAFFESAQPLYRGTVTGIWSEEIGRAMVTEVD